MKISLLDPLHTGFSHTADMLPLVHGGKTWRVTPSEWLADYLNTGTIHINNLAVGSSFSVTGPTGFLPLAGGTMTGPLQVPSVFTASANPNTPLVGPGGNAVMRVIGTNTSSPGIVIDAFGGGFTSLIGRSSKGTALSPSTGGGVTAGSQLLTLQGQGFGTASFFAPAQFAIVAGETFTDTVHGGYMTFQTVALGTAPLVERMRLDDAGSLLIGLTARTTTAKLQVTGGALVDSLVIGLFATQKNDLTIIPGVANTTPVQISANGPGGIAITSALTSTLNLAANQVFAATFGDANNDLSDHLTLHPNGYGFGITANRLNNIVPTGAASVFVVGSADVATINAAGLTLAGTAAGIALSGPLTASGALTLGISGTKTGASYACVAGDHSLILAPTGAFTLTLPAAVPIGRVIRLKLTAAFAVVSASANVVPLIGGSPTTAIMPATAGKFCLLQSDGSNWQIMQAN